MDKVAFYRGTAYNDIMQQPSNLRRCGDLFIKFTKDGQPQYGFTYDAYHRTLKRYYNLHDDPTLADLLAPVKRIELPVWDLAKSPVKVDNQAMLAALQVYATPKSATDSIDRTFAEQVLADYAQGGIKIADGCFAGQKELQLVVPGDYSVLLDWGCFDDDAKVELVTAPDMTLKQVSRTFDTGCDYAHENWTLLCHYDFNYAHEGSHESYFVRDFRANDARCQFSLAPAPKLTTCTVMPVYANFKLHPYHRPTTAPQGYLPITPADDGKTL